jgi:hypothetical protein
LLPEFYKNTNNRWQANCGISLQIDPMKKQTKKADTAADARKAETSKGTSAGTSATGPKKQATEPSTRNTIANTETREADNEFHGMGEKERD